MSKKYLVDVDLSKNQLLNARVQNLSSDPSSPVVGQTYFNTVSNKLRTYNGSTWDEYGTGAGAGSVTSVSVVSANGFAGTVATSTTTPAITLTATPTGILKSNGTAISAATSGTDFAPATSGTSILKASSGGFANAVSGTDYAPATATTSSLKGNGSGGFSAATLNDNGAPTADFSMASHKLTNVTDPTSAQDAATKNYVDGVAQGLSAKPSVVAIATSNISLSAPQTIDGVSVVAGNRVLAVGQTTASQNGIWVANASTWTRPTDFASGSSQLGTYVFVEGGTTNASSGWVLSGTSAVTVDTTSQTWVQFSGAGEITAGTGLNKSGNTLSIENSGVLTIAHGGTGTASLPTGLLKGAGTSAVTAATAGTDYVVPSGSITGNAATATKLATARNINGVAFDGTANITISTTTKFTATIGDGSTTAIAVTHSLGTQDVLAQVRDATTNAVVECDITQTSTTVTTFTFASAPASNAYKVVIIG